MAGTQDIRIDVVVNDGGSTKKVADGASLLAKNLDNVTASATRAGSAVKASMAPSGGAQTTSKLKDATKSPQETAEYGKARAAGGTGAAGRDFAKQAQGLGGLVHLYATYAANIFAVTAAFEGLSRAMDTTNMVKGLDQLGAASGSSLGSLSKKLVEASDGAISFKDAMEAVGKATTAGLSSKQLLQLGEVAKKSSQALGLSMPDALSRLTRGVVKLEPELLDELGIFTKLGKSTEDYARKIGKTVDSLTDYEKRQAFANAVAAEGIQKFSEIQIDANPYDKLLSKLKDVSQSILEVINKGLGPLAKLLSESPNALALGIGGLAIMLVRQALPAIGQYRESLRKSANESKEFAESRAKAAQEALRKSIIYNGKEIQAQKDKIAEMRDNQLTEAESNLKAVSKRGLDKGVRDILKKQDISTITKEDLTYIDKLGESNRKAAGSYRQLAEAIRAAQKANDDFHKAGADIDAKLKTKPPIYSAAGIAGIRAESARKSAASKGIVAQAGETVAIEGIGAALSGMLSSIKTEKLGLVRGGITGIAGAFNILGVAVSGVMTVLSKFLGWVGVAVGVYELLSSVFSKNAKELDAYNSALTESEDAIKAAISTNKKYGDSITVESILAKSTALSALSDSAAKVSKTFLEATDASQGWLDKLTNNLKKPFGADIDSKFKENITATIKNSLSSISDPKLRKEAEEKIAALTGARSFDGVGTAIDRMDTGKLKALAEDLPKGLQDVAEKSKAASMPLNSLKDGYTALEKSYQDLSNTLINTDPLTKFGLTLGRQASLMADVFKDPINSIAALQDILKDTSKIQMFPPEVQKSILAAANQVEGLAAEIKSSQDEIDRATAQIKTAKDLEAAGVPSTVYLELRMRGEGLLQSATETYTAATNKLNNIKDNVQAGLTSTVKQAFGLIEAPLARAVAQAGIDSQKALLNALPKTPQVAKLQTDLEIQSINLKRDEISAINRLINAVDLERISREKAPLEEKMKTAFKEGKVEDFKNYKAEYDKLVQKERAINDPKGLAADIRSGKETLSPAAQEAFARNRGLQTQLAALSAQEQAALINGVVANVSATFDQAKSILQGDLELLKAKNEQFYESIGFKQLSESEQAREKATRTAKEQETATGIANLPKAQQIATTLAIEDEAKARGFTKVAAAAKDATQFLQDELDVTTKTQKIIAKTVETRSDYNITLDESLKKMDKELATKQASAALESAKKQVALDTIAAQKDYNTALAQQMQFNDNELKALNDIAAQQTRELEHEQRLAQLNIQKYEALLNYDKLLAQTQDPAEQTRLKELKKSTESLYTVQIDGENKVYALKTKTAELTEGMDARTLNMANAFEKAFKGMEDAIVNFVSTGKLNFKSMINSFLEDLLRYEIRQQQVAMFQGYGGAAGLAKMVGTFLGFGQSQPGVQVGGYNPASDVTATLSAGYKNAKGGVYDTYGVEAFAKGGMFTNSIVNSPTMFKFAKGASMGLMGEAGPEAIMPLKRDSQGNLGVRAGGGGGNTQVVVNNYGSEKATTKESVDSRGNRKIEVIIGDIVAGELNRPGSTTQQAMTASYGAAPMVARR